MFKSIKTTHSPVISKVSPRNDSVILNMYWKFVSFLPYTRMYGSFPGNVKSQGLIRMTLKELLENGVF